MLVLLHHHNGCHGKDLGAGPASPRGSQICAGVTFLLSNKQMQLLSQQQQKS